MNKQPLAILKRFAVLALFVLVLAPISTFAQRRWVAHRNRVVIYQSRQYVIERPRTTYRYRTHTFGYPQSYYSAYGYPQSYYSAYGYPQSYYSTYYSNGYGYTQPYYASPYYGYRYTQPYYVNRYSYITPSYRYYDNGYYRRHRRSGITLRFGFR
jgi:hypothetical protein